MDTDCRRHILPPSSGLKNVLQRIYQITKVIGRRLSDPLGGGRKRNQAQTKGNGAQRSGHFEGHDHSSRHRRKMECEGSLTLLGHILQPVYIIEPTPRHTQLIPEVGRSMLFRNVGTLLLNYTVPHPTRSYLYTYCNPEDGDSSSSETLIHIYQKLHGHIPEDCIYIHCNCEDGRSSFLRNIAIYIPKYTQQDPIDPCSQNNPENGGSSSLRNVGTFMPHSKMLRPQILV